MQMTWEGGPVVYLGSLAGRRMARVQRFPDRWHVYDTRSAGGPGRLPDGDCHTADAAKQYAEDVMLIAES